MGNTIRKVYFNATRPIRNFNIERRAHKFISKEKPIPAPQYESTLKQIEVSKQCKSNCKIIIKGKSNEEKEDLIEDLIFSVKFQMILILWINKN